MARVFISHSSADKPTARKLRTDLEQLGHSAWLDEQSIKVGDSVTGKIAEGIQNADFVVVLLSPKSVSSGWVDREWKAKYWDEVQSARVSVLPALLENCDIPVLLRDKEYADFRVNYLHGMVALHEALTVAIAISPLSALAAARAPTRDDRVHGLLAALSARQEPLAKVVADILRFAAEANDEELGRVCRIHVFGIPKGSYPEGVSDDVDSAEMCRAVKVYVGMGVDINPSAWAFGGDPEKVIAFMQRSSDFRWFRFVLPEPLAELERRANDSKPGGILRILLDGKTVFKIESPRAQELIPAYARWDSHLDVVESIRTDVLRRLMSHLPPAASRG